MTAILRLSKGKKFFIFKRNEYNFQNMAETYQSVTYVP